MLRPCLQWGYYRDAESYSPVKSTGARGGRGNIRRMGKERDTLPPIFVQFGLMVTGIQQQWQAQNWSAVLPNAYICARDTGLRPDRSLRGL